MKYALLLALLPLSCAQIEGLVTPGPKTCAGPYAEYEGAELLQCQNAEGNFCCAYAYVNEEKQQICFHIICVPTATCDAEWSYHGEACFDPAPAEEQIDIREADSL